MYRIVFISVFVIKLVSNQDKIIKKLQPLCTSRYALDIAYSKLINPQYDI